MTIDYLLSLLLQKLLEQFRDRKTSMNETINCAFEIVTLAQRLGDTQKATNLNEIIENCQKRWKELENELSDKMEQCNERSNMIDRLHGKNSSS